MTCAEFQKVLPYIIESGGNEEEEAHLRDCPVCADLVADLRYIAEQAKLLVPMEDPAPRVWTGIQKALQQEGLVRPADARGRLLGSQPWGSVPWLVLAAVVIVLAAAVMFYRGNDSRLAENPENQLLSIPAQTAQTANVEDEQLLAALPSTDPELRTTFADNLKSVNLYISDAQRSVSENPDDVDARQSLIQAYQQKALLYDMALSRSLK